MDPSLLISQEDILLPGGVAVSFKNLVEPNGYHYGNSDGDEVIITYNQISGNMFGVLTTADGRSFAMFGRSLMFQALYKKMVWI